MTRAGVWAVRAAASALAAGLLGACGASPTPVGETGVDGLTIPTPSPDPADFVAGVDHPWFPLTPGTTWTYRRSTPYGSQTLVAAVLAQPREVAGVATTAVRWQSVRPGRRSTLVVRWYAEDAAGNVWWFGQEVRRAAPRVDPLARRSWRAGVDGAQAGLLLSAQPRVGDGYANATAPGVVDRRSTVVSLTASVATPGRTYRDTVLTRDTSTLEPIEVEQTFFARGLGMVAQQTADATTSDLSLVRMHTP
jgi:hypothetical protein